MIIAFWVLFVISLIVIIVSFIMAPDSNPSSGALVGSSDLDLFKQVKERGSKKILKYSMFIFGILILVVSVVVRALS